jgi:hypothetical protein
MFRVATRGVSQEFERWTDALEAGKALIPQCKSLLQDIRIFDGDQLGLQSIAHLPAICGRRQLQPIGADVYCRGDR